MPIVFVHGVNTRKGKEYDEQVKRRDDYFKRLAFKGLAAHDAVTIFNPYWGDNAAMFSWNLASLPIAGTERFGGEDQDVALLASSFLQGVAAPREKVVLQIAKSSLIDAIDLLWATRRIDTNSTSDLASLGRRAIAYAQEHPQPDWLRDLENDQQLVNELAFHVTDWTRETSPDESFGIDEAWDSIKEAADRVSGAVGGLTSNALLSLFRSGLNESVSKFIGDAFVYLNKRGDADHPGPIVETIAGELLAAQREISTDDPFFVVVGHSMGGCIMYDMLTHFLPKMHPELRIDAFVTVGSQVGLFEEMKLYCASDPKIPRDDCTTLPLPPAAKKWINTFDENDVFAFATSKIWSGVGDFSYSTGQSTLSAHTAYFLIPSFYLRLAKRLEEIL
jgi:hypothetical protein